MTIARLLFIALWGLMPWTCLATDLAEKLAAEDLGRLSTFEVHDTNRMQVSRSIDQPVAIVFEPHDDESDEDGDLFPEALPSDVEFAPPRDARSVFEQSEGRPAAELKALRQAAAGAYKDPFYNNNFSYLNDPDYEGCLLGERLKQWRLPFCDCCTTLDLGTISPQVSR